jgi:exosortase/archaeosortase family protein
MSLSFLALVYGYLFDGRNWMKWVLLAATVPIAVLANSGRVAITGVLGEIDPELAQGIYHSLEGWVIFVAAVVLLMGTHKLADMLATRFAGSA